MASFRAYSPRAPLGRGTRRASISPTDHPALVVRDRSCPVPAVCVCRPTLGSRGGGLPPGLVVCPSLTGAPLAIVGEQEAIRPLTLLVAGCGQELPSPKAGPVKMSGGLGAKI